MFCTHQSGSSSKIKNVQDVGIHALSYQYKFQNVLMSPFGDIDNQLFIWSITHSFFVQKKNFIAVT